LRVKLSIIVATHERPISLGRLLHSLEPQLIPGRHELFVAENGTPTQTRIEIPGVDLVHLHNAKPGKCYIQNRAISLATGEIVIFLDDDVIVTPNYLNAVESFFDQYPHFSGMGGRILPAQDPRVIAGSTAPYLDLPIVDHGEETLDIPGAVGANMAFRASALRVVGVFDERLGPGAAGHEEETELCRRLRCAGMKIGYAPRALVLHEVDPGRAVRTRFIRVARERGYCRTLHEHHSQGEVAIKIAIAAIRLVLARTFKATVGRIAREERRLAVAQGMREGLRKRTAARPE
jgi:GT2 family glycosyltransferase